MTVQPLDKDLTPLAPALFILSPAAPWGPEAPVEPRGPDVCLAANFRPRGGTMRLDQSVALSTDGAVLSVKHKSFFFAGFSRQSIGSCSLHGASVSRTAPEPAPEPTAGSTPGSSPGSSPGTTEVIKAAETAPIRQSCMDCYPDAAKVNFYLLLFNGVRVLLVKSVAFSTILTIRALLVQA